MSSYAMPVFFWMFLKCVVFCDLKISLISTACSCVRCMCVMCACPRAILLPATNADTDAREVARAHGEHTHRLEGDAVADLKEAHTLVSPDRLVGAAAVGHLGVWHSPRHQPVFARAHYSSRHTRSKSARQLQGERGAATFPLGICLELVDDFGGVSHHVASAGQRTRRQTVNLVCESTVYAL